MIPFVRELAFEYGRCDQVSPLIRRVIARNPGPFTYTGTGVYIVGRGEVAVIDPGPDLPEHFEALKAALVRERDTPTTIWTTAPSPARWPSYSARRSMAAPRRQAMAKPRRAWRKAPTTTSGPTSNSPMAT